MEQAKINREYKAENPYRTINRIRGIIEKLGIFVIEEHIDNKEGNLYSCRLRIINNNLFYLNLGTNGKGITPEYSLASAYGELMERLQNSIVFHGNHHAYFTDKDLLNQDNDLYKRLKSKNAILDYLYFPDEVTCDGEVFIEKFSKYFEKIFQNNNQQEIIDFGNQYFNSKKHIGVQFYNANQGEVQLLPYELIRMFSASNGMCAGNTPHEALMQGLGECFERYAIRKIFMNNPELPSIPFDYFRNTNVYQELIRLQEEEALSVIIKDCSLEIGIPVILLVILNRKLNKYFVCAGADPSPTIALERCLTELYQGGIEFKMNDFTYMEKTFVDEDGFKCKNKLIRSYYDNMIKGEGAWPNSILDNSKCAFPKWKQFNTEKENFDYYTKLIISLGYDVFIRDCSNLGFPSFHIYIPGLSEIYNTNNIYELKLLLEISPKLSSISNISNWKENDKRKVFESIEKIQKIITPFEYSTQGVLPPINPESIQDINVNKLKYLLPYQFKDYGLAKLKLDEFRVHNSFSDEEQVVMSIVSDYLGLLSQGKSDEEAINILNNFFSKELIRKLKKEMQLMEELFNKEKTPFTCYDCNECNIINDCKLVELASVTAQINAEQKKNIINQESISQLLN